MTVCHLYIPFVVVFVQFFAHVLIGLFVFCCCFLTVCPILLAKFFISMYFEEIFCVACLSILLIVSVSEQEGESTEPVTLNLGLSFLVFLISDIFLR